MARSRAVPIGGVRFFCKERQTVTFPYDGDAIADHPVWAAGDVDRAVDAARHALQTEPLPAWRRAEILDTAARLLDERKESFARTLAEESAKPIKTARV